MIHNKKKSISVLITIVGIIVAIYGFILCIMSNINLGVVLVVILGVFAINIGIFYEKIKELTKSGFFKYFKVFVIAILCIEFILVSFIAVFGIVDNISYNEDAVIVLGAGIRGDKVTLPLKMRLDKAIQYHSKNPEAIIVVTGGQGFQETVTEAYAMEKYLVEHGVERNKIIKEEKATSTTENMEFSKVLLDKYFEDNYSIVVVTNNFHVFRGTSIAIKTGFNDVSHTHAGLQWYNLMPCYLRESLAVLKTLILD